jgi:transcription elongation factor Elf1
MKTKFICPHCNEIYIGDLDITFIKNKDDVEINCNVCFNKFVPKLRVYIKELLIEGLPELLGIRYLKYE